MVVRNERTYIQYTYPSEKFCVIFCIIAVLILEKKHEISCFFKALSTFLKILDLRFAEILNKFVMIFILRLALLWKSQFLP